MHEYEHLSVHVCMYVHACMHTPQQVTIICMHVYTCLLMPCPDQSSKNMMAEVGTCKVPIT